MITDAIINVLLGPIFLLFKLFSLPVVDNLAVPDGVFDALMTCLANVAYVFPFKTAVFMLGFIFALDHFKVIWALILRIKSFIPSMGH